MGCCESSEPIFMAIKEGDVSKVEALLKSGEATVNQIDGGALGSGFNATCYAALYNKWNVVKVLQKHGGDINAAGQNEWGSRIGDRVQTVMMSENYRDIWNGSVETLKGLIEHGYDVNLVTRTNSKYKSGSMLQQYCRQTDYYSDKTRAFLKNIFPLLLKGGAKVGPHNGHDKTCIQMLSPATKKKFPELVSMLQDAYNKEQTSQNEEKKIKETMKEWTIDEVYSYMKDHEILQLVAEKCKNEEIDGATLLAMNDNDFNVMFSDLSRGKLIKIRGAIEELQNKLKPPQTTNQTDAYDNIILKEVGKGVAKSGGEKLADTVFSL